MLPFCFFYSIEMLRIVTNFPLTLTMKIKRLLEMNKRTLDCLFK